MVHVTLGSISVSRELPNGTPNSLKGAPGENATECNLRCRQHLTAHLEIQCSLDDKLQSCSTYGLERSMFPGAEEGTVHMLGFML